MTERPAGADQTESNKTSLNPSALQTWIEFDGRVPGWDEWPAAITIYEPLNLVEVEVRPRNGPSKQQPPMQRVMLPLNVLRQLILRSEDGA